MKGLIKIPNRTDDNGLDSIDERTGMQENVTNKVNSIITNPSEYRNIFPRSKRNSGETTS